MPRSLEHSGTSWRGQRLKHGQSVIDQLDPRLRVLAAALASTVVVSTSAFAVLCAGLVLALSVAVIARLSFKRTFRRVIAMDMFMLFLLIVLPFTTPGEPMFSVGGYQASWQGGLHALQITLKANAVILFMLSLIGTLDATTLGHALAHLKVPEKLVHLMLFMVRYLDVIGREYKRMHRAMLARGFVMKTNLHTWRSMGYLVGMLLVHSLDRSERILAAMECRGFNGRFYLLDDMRLQRLDYGFAVMWLLLLAAIAGLNLL